MVPEMRPSHPSCPQEWAGSATSHRPPEGEYFILLNVVIADPSCDLAAGAWQLLSQRPYPLGDTSKPAPLRRASRV